MKLGIIKNSFLSRLLLPGLLLCAAAIHSAENPAWEDVIREAPYRTSLGMTDNLMTIRSWVLLNRGYCEQPQRHILFDLQGRFLTWLDNAEGSPQTQQQLNRIREDLVERGDVERWIPGSEINMGYPFAFACDQPHVDVSAAFDRLFGRAGNSRLWGTWDGMTAGSEAAPISLFETVQLVWQQRQSGLAEPIDSFSLPLFLSQLVLESGGIKSAHSTANAVGILQLTPQALADCGIDRKFYRHRMAQVDCAVRLYVVNRRNLESSFERVFGHLPAAKRERLFSLLLVQSYHSGIGNLTRLLTDAEQGRAAHYFAEQHERFSADDIMTGMLFHNLGRPPWGWASLYYLIDIELIENSLCSDPDLPITCESDR